MKNTDSGSVIRILVIVVAILTAATFFAISSDRDHKFKTQCTATVQGQITSCQYPATLSTKHVSNAMNRLEASYKIGNLTYHCKGRSRSWYHSGDEVTVHYDPNDPTRAYVGTDPSSLGYTIYVYLGSACAFIAAALRPMLAGSRRNRY